MYGDLLLLNLLGWIVVIVFGWRRVKFFLEMLVIMLLLDCLIFWWGFWDFLEGLVVMFWWWFSDFLEGWVDDVIGSCLLFLGWLIVFIVEWCVFVFWRILVVLLDVVVCWCWDLVIVDFVFVDFCFVFDVFDVLMKFGFCCFRL